VLDRLLFYFVVRQICVYNPNVSGTCRSGRVLSGSGAEGYARFSCAVVCQWTKRVYTDEVIRELLSEIVRWFPIHVGG
jgi:hypothetical protein